MTKPTIIRMQNNGEADLTTGVALLYRITPKKKRATKTKMTTRATTTMTIGSEYER